MIKKSLKKSKNYQKIIEIHKKMIKMMLKILKNH